SSGSPSSIASRRPSSRILSDPTISPRRLILALGALLTLASVRIAWSHLARVRRATSGRTAELVVALKRLPASERAAALATRAPEGSAERRLAALIQPTDEATGEA